ncbi:MAG TPA: 3-hydroxyacyl-CoA dehydrogenase NAD-binding domain-containing protein [Anaerolineaceae bacterium]
MDDGIRNVVVAGAGQMGPGIAFIVAQAGCQVTLVDIDDEHVRQGRVKFEGVGNFLVQHGVITPLEADSARSRLTFTTDRSNLKNADLVIECIPEHLPTKQKFFASLEYDCPPATILASNTSGLRISDIALLMQHPERAVTTHFWMPAHLIPLVEVIQGEKTAPEIADRVAAFLRRCGKKPVIGRKDLPGQICNRLFQAVIREASYMVQEGVASTEDVETAVKAGMGIRFPVYGPLEHLDSVGLDLALAVQASVLPSLCNSSEPVQLLKDLVAAGNLGAKTGRGFYDWTTRSVDELRSNRDLFLVERLIAEKKAQKPEVK